MIETFFLFMLAAAVAVALGSLVVWSRRGLAPRLLGLGLCVAMIGVIGVGIVDLLGRPKPTRMEWVQRHGEEADVLASRIVEGKAIYLWLGMPGEAEPRAYVLPWDLETAKALQKAVEQAAKDGGQARAVLPFERSWETREPKFYALPQPKLPDKPVGPPPLEYQRRTEGA